ncbi:MAG: sugar phosphate isomerase/epimerase [Bacteroidota bacterium]|nr:sugar phosphate isomerase/epimerase [Bacteroidota bacterium]
MHFSRRNFLRLSGTGLLATQAPSLLTAGQPASEKGPEVPFELGIASYTFREFSLEDTIAMTEKLGISKLCLKSMHMPLDSSPADIKSMASKISEAGIDLYGGGVIYMSDDEAVENAFTYAINAGMKVIVGVPEHELLDLCNKKVKETGIRLAIHNHGPGDKKYPTATSAFELIKDMDPGIGLCVDIGHTARLGLDPIADTRKYMDRVHDIHIKDVDKADASGSSCEMGHGVIDIPGFLKMLLEENYSKVVSFEYEKDGKDPLAGLAESVGYVRGVLKMLT